MCLQFMQWMKSPVPVFHDLTQMELFFNFKGDNWGWMWRWMQRALRRSPKLQHLTITIHEVDFTYVYDNLMIYFVNSISTHLNIFFLVGISLNCLQEIKDEDTWKDPKVTPKCLSSQLRTCLLKDCRGRKCELQFAEYVMQNSKVLRTMTIHSACSLDLNVKHQMFQKLSVCPRGCKLIFNWW